MISTSMRLYDYTRLSKQIDAFGQETEEPTTNKVKMSINLITQNNTENIKYKEANYIGLTHDKTIDDTCTIQYGKEKLKVLYVNANSRLIQVYLKEI